MTDRLVALHIDDGGRPAPSAEIEQERRVAVLDLLEANSFALPPRDGRPAQGPWKLSLAIREGRLVFAVTSEQGEPAGEFHMSLGPFRQVVKDYGQICDSYYEAVRTRPPAQIEAIDMARGGFHNEGARGLRDRMEGRATLAPEGARRLSGRTCVLRWGG